MRGSALFALPLLLFAGGAASAAELASHRAAYRLSLDSTRSAADVVSASGAMLYEAIDRCDAWTVQQRFTLTIVGRDGQSTERQSDYVTWEAKDGLSMRFRLRQMVDGQVAQTIVGEARLPRAGEAGVARYREPTEQEIALPKGTLFPMTHTLRMLEAARADSRTLAAPLFDGTAPDGAMESNTAITGRSPPTPGRFAELAALASWSVRIAFFEPANISGSPDYEVGIRYWENGIADELKMDFGEFVVQGRMETLEVIPGGC